MKNAATKQKTFQDEANDYAHGAIENLAELLATAETEDDDQCIQEDPLSVEIRTDWHSVGDSDNKPTEYNILLGTGGPAARIIGELDEYCQPITAFFEYQDWYKPWTRAQTGDTEDKIMLEYAAHFWFGE